MKKIIYAGLAVFLAVSSAFSLDLQSARKSGVVVEQPDGYIKAVKSSPEAESLEANVNSARKTEYERIAKENGQSVEVVARLAAQELLKKH